MLNLFWNSKERRLRAFWRLLLHTILLISITGVLLFAFLIPAIAIAGPDAFNLGDVELDQDMSDIMARHPALTLISSLAFMGGVFIATWIAGVWFDRRPFRDFGFYLNLAWLRDLFFGLGLGAVLMAGVFLVQLAAGWIIITDTFSSLDYPFLIAILVNVALFLSVGILEELLSRGYHLRNIAEGLNLSAIGARNALLLGYFISSVIFALLHVFNPHASLISSINLILAGLLLGLGFILTRQLAIPIGLHITWNFFQGNVFGFPVSGSETGATFIAIEQGGPELWTGGPFGPEAGLIGIVAILVGALFTVLWVKWTSGAAKIQDGLAEYGSANPEQITKTT
jgi:uncharacterized protein